MLRWVVPGGLVLGYPVTWALVGSSIKGKQALLFIWSMFGTKAWYYMVLYVRKVLFLVFTCENKKVVCSK